jgi:acetolactate synthase-1/2/3 large subunit
MGFGLPAAIGAFFSDKTRQIVCLNTDGGIMFNLQELQTICYWKIPMKLFIFNNDGYTMIKVSQANLFEGREFGSSTISGVSFPNFKDLAESFDMNYFRIQDVNDLNSHLTEELKAERSTLFEVIMDPHQRYLPRLGTTRLLDGTLVSPPLEDLDPKISLSALSQVLEGGVHEASRTSRQS